MERRKVPIERMRFAALGQLRHGIGSLGLEPVEAVSRSATSNPTRDFAIGPASHGVRHLGLACVGRCRGIVIEAADEDREASEIRPIRPLLAGQLGVPVERGNDRLVAGLSSLPANDRRGVLRPMSFVLGTSEGFGTKLIGIHCRSWTTGPNRRKLCDSETSSTGCGVHFASICISLLSRRAKATYNGGS